MTDKFLNPLGLMDVVAKIKRWINDSSYGTRCSGIIQDQILNIGYNKLTPVVEDGNMSLVDATNKRFVAITDGLYLISIGGGSVPNIKFNTLSNICSGDLTALVSSLFKGDTTSIPANTLAIASGASNNIGSITKAVWLNEGEFMSYHINCDIEQESINYLGTIHKFEFSLIKTVFK